MEDDTSRHDDTVSNEQREALSGSHKERLSAAVDDGGGCTNAWEAAQAIRESTDEGVDRRSTLRRLGAGVATVAAASTPVSAATEGHVASFSDPERGFIEAYTDPVAVERDFSEHVSTETLTTLSAEGIISSPQIDEFSISDGLSPLSPHSDGIATVLPGEALNAERATRVVSVIREVDGVGVELVIEPEIGVDGAWIWNDGYDVATEPDAFVSENSVSSTSGDCDLCCSYCTSGSCGFLGWSNPQVLVYCGYSCGTSGDYECVTRSYRCC